MKKNILLIQTDEHHHQWLGFRGAPGLKTPHIDALAADGSVVFNHAYSCSGVCVPSRVSLMTGRYPIGHGVMTNNISQRPQNEPWLGKQLQELGYRTGYFGKSHFAGNDADLSTEGWATSFTKFHYKDYLLKHGIDAKYPEGRNIDLKPSSYWTMGTSRIPNEHYFENAVSDHAAQFIAEESDQPFAAYVSNIAPHGPFTPPEPYASMYDPNDIVLPERIAGEVDGKPHQTQRWIKQNAKYFQEPELRDWLALVYGLITLVDDNVGKLVKALKDSGQYDNTLIVFLSDHGDFACRYGIIGKSWTMTDDLIRIPLIVRHPRDETFDDSNLAAGESDALVQSIDVTATLLEWAGSEPIPHTSGQSLLPLLRNETNEHRDIVFACDHAEYSEDHLYLSMARTREHKLVVAGDGQAELYDMKADPMERNNLADDAALAPVHTKMQGQILQWHIEHSGLYYDPAKAAYWEDETCFYDETVFCGERIRKVKGGTPTS